MRNADGQAEPAPGASRRSVSNAIDGTLIGSTVVQVGHLTVQLPPPAASRVPRQLPPAPRRFVNRTLEIQTLDEALDDTEVGSASLVMLTGMRGVGKTATSRHWAHAKSERFGDGQLHADLGELRHRGGVVVSDILGSFLQALGLSEEDIPVGLAERTALFRSATAGKRILLLLEDVEQPAQVRPLIPGTAEAMVLITTRTAIDELVHRDGASVIRLAPLDQHNSAAILAEMIGRDRLEHEPAAVAGVTDICAGLPVALRICGARLLNSQQRPISKLVDELADEAGRLDRIRVSEDTSIDVVFTDAYRALAPASQELYAYLGCHPGISFNAALAAASSDVSIDDASLHLEELRTANLIEGPDEQPRFHGLLRIHARRTAERHIEQAARETALARIVGHYLDAAKRMDRALIPIRLRLAPEPPDPPDGAPQLRSASEAVAWFETERPNILAVMRAAAEREWDAPVWQLGEALWLAYHNRKHFGEALEVYTLAVESAGRCGDPAAEARLRLQLSRAYMDLEDLSGAARELEVARGLAERAEHRALQASVIEFAGILDINRDRLPDAIAALETSRSIYQSLRNPRGIAIQEYHLGRARSLSGQHQPAVECYRRAAELIDGEQDGLTLGRVLLHLGEAQQALRDNDAACKTLSQAAELMRAHAAPFYEAMARQRLGIILSEAGDSRGARTQWTNALEIFAALGSPRAAEVSAQLATSPDRA